MFEGHLVLKCMHHILSNVILQSMSVRIVQCLMACMSSASCQPEDPLVISLALLYVGTNFCRFIMDFWVSINL